MIKNKHIGHIIQCHIDPSDPDTFVVGELISFDDKWFFMKDVSSYGESNGFALYQRSDLCGVEDRSEYIDKIAFLLQYNHASWPDIQIQENNLLKQIIELCNHSGKVVGIETYASGFRDINGIIETIDKGVITLRQIDEYGRDDGKCWLDTNSITRMFFDDKESIYLNVLYDHARK